MPRQHATYETLHTASMAVSALRGGLTSASGADPRHMKDILTGRRPSDSVGLRNVDERLRTIFGHGLTVETGIGVGTKVTMRLPKYGAAASAA